MIVTPDLPEQDDRCTCGASQWPHYHVNDFVPSALADREMARMLERWRREDHNAAKRQLEKEIFGD